MAEVSPLRQRMIEDLTIRNLSMTWAQRLKRVFGIEIESCEHCGSPPPSSCHASVCTPVTPSFQA